MPVFTRGQWTQYNTNTWYSQRYQQPPGSGQDMQVLKGGLTAMNGATGGGGFGPWIGGDYDTTRDVLHIGPTGGDQDWGDNEVIDWALATGAWTRTVDPTVNLFQFHLVNGAAGTFLGTNGAAAAYIDTLNQYPTNVTTSQGGLKLYPNGVHSYGGVCYMPTVQKFFHILGQCWWGNNAGAAFVPFEYDPSTKRWEGIDSDAGFTTWTPASFQPYSCWDSVASRVLFSDGGSLFAYYPGRVYGSRVVKLADHPSGLAANSLNSMFHDPILNRAIVIGTRGNFANTGNGMTYWDLTVSPPTLHTLTITGTAPPTFGPIGARYDPIGRQYVFWAGAKTLYLVNPTTLVGAPLTPSSGDMPDDFTGLAAGGCYGRFFYSPNQDVFGAITHGNGNGFVIPLVRISAPVLACSDITSGPRTGNPDTAFGQIANANGAYVTVFGYNLGTLGDIVTATVGGVNALIVDSGQCLPPRCPATLYNQYTKLQQITLQVPGTAPLGSQIIDVVVNGRSSVSFDLPFTVTNSGTIRLTTASGGTLLNILNNQMVGGDITYLQTGAALTGGWVMGSNTTGGTQMAIGAYPGATVQFGDNSHDAILQGASGSGRNLTMFKLVCRGNNVAPFQPVTLLSNSRFVGCNLQCSNGQGSAGALGGSPTSSQAGLAVLANEFTNCGAAPADAQYHVVYISGTRNSAGTPTIESGYEIAYNYFHDNNAARAINCFNRNTGTGPGNIDNPIGGFHIHHNVIVNQQYAGIGLLNGVVGANRVHDNLLINCGLNTGGPSGAPADGMEIHPVYTAGYPDTSVPITVEISNNTLFNCGDFSATSSRGAYKFSNTTFVTGWTLTFRDNITYQLNGVQYLSSDSDAIAADPTTKSNNLWFGAGAPPSFDSPPTVITDPQVVSATSPFDFHLQTTSPAIGAGAVLSTTSLDLDGNHRATSGVWDQGAYAFTGVTTITAPILTSLVPSTCLPGAASFTLTIFASPTQGFTTGATIFWDSAMRTTTFVNSQQVTITVPAADVAVAGAHLVTATNPGSAVSNSLQFNVSLGAASLTLVWNGLAADRVSPSPSGLAADGNLDGTVTATLHGSGGRTITALSMQATNASNTNIGTWNTLNTAYVLGAALTIGGAYLNNAVTMAVNFTVADNGTFVVFGSDFPTVVGGIEFVPGNTLTLTATFSDGETATGSVLIVQSTPVITSLSPPSQPVGSPGFVLTVFGTGFQSGAVIKWNGASRTTTFVSSTTVQMNVLVSDVAALGTATVTVTNLDLSASNTATFSIVPVVQTGTFVSSVM